MADYTVDELCDWMEFTSLPLLIGSIRAAKIAGAGRPLFLYEAGQHVRGDKVASSIEAQGSEQMGRVYRAFLAAMDAAGVDLFCNYQGPHAWSGYHTFGIMERTGEWTPKYRALREWAGV